MTCRLVINLGTANDPGPLIAPLETDQVALRSFAFCTSAGKPKVPRLDADALASIRSPITPLPFTVTPGFCCVQAHTLSKKRARVFIINGSIQPAGADYA